MIKRILSHLALLFISSVSWAQDSIVTTRVSDQDGTTLFGWGTHDTVLFQPRPMIGPSVCVSVQKGCALKATSQGCGFCSTGRFVDFQGSLSAEAIANQALYAFQQVENIATHDRVRVVFAGMGDSSYNAKNVVEAMSLLQRKFAPKKVDFVIASVGVPLASFQSLQTELLAALKAEKLEKGTQIYPQLSLHSANSEKRGKIIPPARSISVEEVVSSALNLVESLRPYVEPVLHDPEFPDRLLLTFNYVMLGPKGGFPGNHTEEDLQALISLVQAFGKDRIAVRLSAYNPDRRDGLHSFGNVGDEVFVRWISRLKQEGIHVRRFLSQGRDIRGGCGQLLGPAYPAPH